MYSSTIKIANLNDYIGISQECVLPLLNPKSTKSLVAVSDLKQSKIIQEPNLILKSKKQTAKVTLSDCLACSGCITTAESVLNQSQNINEFIEKTKSKKAIFLAISSQSRVSLAAHFDVSEDHIQSSLTRFFTTKLNASHLFDMRLANEIALEMCYQEFQFNQNLKQADQSIKTLLASECPGWVCFAEKTLDEYIIDHMSKIKSPQQIMGELVKLLLSKQIGIPASESLFVTIMPCLDKKVESFRQQFAEKNNHIVDVVLTTSEIIDLINLMENNDPCCSENLPSSCDSEKKAQIIVCQNEKPILQESKSIDRFDAFPYNFTDQKQEYIYNIEDLLFMKQGNQQPNRLQRCISAQSTGSNDYLDYILKKVMNQSFDQNNKYLTVTETIGKNTDLKEYSLNDGERVVATFARVYGLKNIQNLARKIKTKTCKYDYVEIMACPSGCLNGGGQLKPISLDNELKPKQHVEILTQIMFQKEVIKEDVQVDLISSAIQRLKTEGISLQTSFQHIDKQQSMSSLAW